MVASTGPVSYTHLDVYKRQIRASDKHLVYHFSIGTLLFVFVAVLLLLNIKPVSYTHLDVYKRQA